MSPEGAFAAVQTAFGAEPGIGRGRMFGSNGLKVDGRIFAMLVKDRLVVKLPAARVDALIRDGRAIRFDPGHGRLMREWASIGEPSEQEWLALAREARAFVAG